MVIEEFRMWATTIGCPPNRIPSDDALKSVFKSRQREIFVDLMQRVRSIQEVKVVRENLLLRQLEGIEQVVPVCSRNLLPKQMQRYLMVTDLQKKKAVLEAELNEKRREYDEVAGYIKKKNLQCITAEHKYKLLQDKMHLLSFKSDALDADIEREQRNGELILAKTPVKLTAKNASEKEIIQAVELAIKELQLFYSVSNINAQLMQEAKEKLWQRMREVFSNKPNFLIFNTIMRHKAEQLEAVTTLKQNSFDESHSLSGAGKEPLTVFEMESMKLKADLMGQAAQYIAAHNERLLLEERFSKAFPAYLEVLQKKLNFSQTENVEEQDDDVLYDFILQYNALTFTKAQIGHIAEQLKLYRFRLTTGTKQLENHHSLLNILNQRYGSIDSAINRMHFEMALLAQVKDKITYSKNIMQHLLADLLTTANSNCSKVLLLPTKMKASGMMSPLGSESFEMGGDSVFCSTKLDLDATGASGSVTLMNTTLRSSENTMVAQIGFGSDASSLSPHRAELSCFSDVSMEHLSCLGPACAFYLSANPLIMTPRGELTSTLHLAPGVLLTPCGALNEVLVRIAASNLIAEHSIDIKSCLDLVTVDVPRLKQRMKQQRENTAEILDKVEITHEHTNRALVKLAKFYSFQKDNSLRHLIPPTKRFNNQLYTDYESEYMLYLRLTAEDWR